MERRASKTDRRSASAIFGTRAYLLLPEAIYLDLVATLFTMSALILSDER